LDIPYLAAATDQPVIPAVAEEKAEERAEEEKAEEEEKARRETPHKPSHGRGKHVAPSKHRIWRALWFIPEPTSEHWWRSWFFRSLILLTGVLILTGLFIATYVGALHNPWPRDIPVGVIKGDAPAHRMLAMVRARDTTLTSIEYPNAAAAQDALRKRQIHAVLTFTADASENPDPQQPAPVTGAALTVATAGAPSIVPVITGVLTTEADAQSMPLAVTDIAPISNEDPFGVVPYYLVVGWVIGGFLAATVLALSAGTVPRTFERAAFRLGALAGFSVLAGLIGALLTGPILGIWPNHILGVTLVGGLIVFATAAVTSALAGWLGMAGIGIAILLFVILGTLGSGGLYAPELLSGLFRGMHYWVLPGLGTDVTRSVVYFAGKGPGRSIIGLVAYAAVGVGGLLAATAVLGRKGIREPVAKTDLEGA
jgi:hypothetical protein